MDAQSNTRMLRGLFATWAVVAVPLLLWTATHLYRVATAGGPTDPVFAVSSAITMTVSQTIAYGTVVFGAVRTVTLRRRDGTLPLDRLHPVLGGRRPELPAEWTAVDHHLLTTNPRESIRWIVGVTVVTVVAVVAITTTPVFDPETTVRAGLSGSGMVRLSLFPLLSVAVAVHAYRNSGFLASALIFFVPVSGLATYGWLVPGDPTTIAVWFSLVGEWNLALTQAVLGTGAHAFLIGTAARILVGDDR